MTALDYSRQAGAADLSVMRRSHIVQVGVGSGSELVRSFTRMGVGKITVIDPDTVEPRNVASQGYTYAAALASVPKVTALERECNAINPETLIVPLREDFVRMSDGRLKEILFDATLLVMATDHHPAQARGALAGLVCDVPTILASLYRRGRAGEIIYTYPGLTEACYRCIAAERYEFVARARAGGTGDAAGSIPFAAAFVDAIVGHLAVGVLHKRHGAANPYADWFEQLGQRNFIQTRMAPDYKLGDEDIFGDVFGHGEKVFAFDTIWQPGVAELKGGCPDCRGRGATPVGLRAHETTEMTTLPGCGCLIQVGSAGGVCPACAEPAAVPA